MKITSELIEKVEAKIQPQFKTIEEICRKNSIKVIEAFQECNLQEMHLISSTGYGTVSYTHLDVYKRQILDREGNIYLDVDKLGLFTNYKSLDLSGQKLTDLKPLKGFT